MERQKELRDLGEKQQTCDDRLLWVALKMRCPALWTDHDDDNTTYYMRVKKGHSGTKVSRAPSKLAAVSNWKTSRRSCMHVCMCVWPYEYTYVCVRVWVFVALSREIKSGITISRSIAWVIEPHSRELCHKSNRFPKRGLSLGFFSCHRKNNNNSFRSCIQPAISSSRRNSSSSALN